MRIVTGEIDGDGWEDLVHKILRIKYPNNYNKVPAKFKGDLGIEGFSYLGHAFQCYCPDGNPSSKELYQRQRDKITADIKKFTQNEDKLLEILDDIQIHRWKFVTPIVEDRSLLKHCRKKEREVKSEDCEHVNNEDFRIQIVEEENYTTEINKLHNSHGLKYEADIPEVDDKKIEEWKSSENEFHNNLDSKLSKIVSEEQRKKVFINVNIKSLIEGEAILHDLQVNFPDTQEKIIQLIDSWEDDVQMKSMLKKANPNALMKDTSEKFRKDLQEEFKDQISTATARRITRQTISFWLCKCPLGF